MTNIISCKTMGEFHIVKKMQKNSAQLEKTTAYSKRVH